MSKGGSSSGVWKSESCDRLEKRQMSRKDGENDHSKLKSREQAILMRNLTRFFVLLFNPTLDLLIKPDPLLKLDLFVALVRSSDDIGTEHAGKANSISQSIVSTCAECTIYRNVNTYINLEPRAHTGNGNGGNDETQARLITERKAFLAALEDPVVALPKILDVIGPAQYDILMETYHGRAGSDYQPPATYLLGL
ncbi:hypothetical protein QFC21_004925 [Naganishia friedmannii]|uniref:Uncharacterized protein n=1 Tax=Naganishia friedmannii TaxID=89922 RepID=A0ACC2VF80_9TREE|nr:hypothetical protein QFC21_004925 [Naganishia friedmannii]